MGHAQVLDIKAETPYVAKDVGPLKPVLSLWLQLALAAMFFGESFVYTIIDPYLPAAFPHTSETFLSATFGAYSAAQLAATLLLVLLHMLPCIASLKPHHDYIISVKAFAVYTAAGCISAVWPRSMEAVLLQRLFLGLTAALFYTHVYKGLARGLNPSDAMRAAAWVNAGLVAGDSLAPIVGDIVYQTSGVRVANAIQPLVCTAVLLLLSGLPASLACRGFSRQQKQQESQPTDEQLCDAGAALNCGFQQPVGFKHEHKGVAGSMSTDLAKLQSAAAAAAGPARKTPPGDQAPSGTAAAACSMNSSDHLILLLRCITNVPLTAQLCMLILTQFVRSLTTILLPEALANEPVWVVPTAYAIQAFCAVLSPFILEAALSRWNHTNTALLLATMAMLLAAASGAMLPAATVSLISAVFICGAVSGIAYSCIEILVFHHATQITRATGCQLAVDVGAILYTLFHTTGNAMGSMVGGAVADLKGAIPAHVTAGVSAMILVYGIGLFAAMHIEARVKRQLLP